MRRNTHSTTVKTNFYKNNKKTYDITFWIRRKGLNNVLILKLEKQLAEEYQVSSPSPFEISFFIKIQYYSLLQNEFYKNTGGTLSTALK